MSSPVSSPDAGSAAATPTFTPKTPETPLAGVSVTCPVELSTVNVKLLLAGSTVALYVMALPLTSVAGMVNVTGVFTAVLHGSDDSEEGRGNAGVGRDGHGERLTGALAGDAVRGP